MQQLQELFPGGITPYLLGGITIGLGVVSIYLLTGLIVGASTFLESTLTFVTGNPHFKKHESSRNWRLLFTIGIVAGAALYALLIEQSLWTTQVQWWRLLAGGILVGFGTRMGKGCTSGHGICGVASLSSTSLINVAIFVAVAIGTAQLVQAIGVTP